MRYRVLIRVLEACLLAAVATLLFPANAAAQSNHVAWSKIELGSWTLHPIYTVTESGSVLVRHFLALTDPSLVVGENLIAVWYQREEAGWIAKSWETTDTWEAINAVKADLNLPDDEDERWGIEGAIVASTPAMHDYTMGVLADDPLALIVAQTTDRDELVGLLVSIGYKAAAIPVELDDGCTLDTILDGFAVAIIETLTGDETAAATRSMASWSASGLFACGISDLAVVIIEHPPRPTTPFLPPTYICAPLIMPGTPACTMQTWTETRTVIQRRTRSRSITRPWIVPPVYIFCDQTRTAIETRTTNCYNCGTTQSPAEPCPPAPAPGDSVPDLCQANWTRTTWSLFGLWTPWAPPCPF